ncbi:NAD-dependent epimerase/dehydratase family protein [Patescibacteria group bacterium]|nr:NAD-dependent epimerase/dehydratase family protein [Patescibacteria group bacterium]
MSTAGAEQNLKLKIGSNKNTALISGGSGFLGSYLCEALVSQGFTVIAVDKPSQNSKENLKGLLTSPNFTLWEEDISKPGFKLSPTVPLTHIFHLASVEEHLPSSRISLQTLLVNSLGTKNLLDLAMQRKAKFLLVSSTEVFHGAMSQTSLEAYFGKGVDPTELSFAEAKRFAENLTAEYFKNYGISTTIVRIKDPYGPRMSLEENDPLGNLINLSVTQNKLELVNDGLKTHNPTYVSDIIYGIIKAALGQHKGEIFNLINPVKLTQSSIAETLKSSLGRLEITYKKGEEVELPSYPLIIDPTKEKLGWIPKVSFAKGLRETIDFIKNKGSSGKQAKSPEASKTFASMTNPTKEKNKGLLLRIILLVSISLLLMWIILLPPALLGLNIYIGQRSLEKANHSMKTDDLKQATTQAQTAESAFQKGERVSRNLFWPAYLPWLGEQVAQTRNYLFFAENISSATKLTTAGLLAVKDFEAGNNGKDIRESTLGKAGKEMNNAERKLELATSLEIEQTKLPAPLKDSYNDLVEQQEELKQLLNVLGPIINNSP